MRNTIDLRKAFIAIVAQESLRQVTDRARDWKVSDSLMRMTAAQEQGLFFCQASYENRVLGEANINWDDCSVLGSLLEEYAEFLKARLVFTMMPALQKKFHSAGLIRWLVMNIDPRHGGPYALRYFELLEQELRETSRFMQPQEFYRIQMLSQAFGISLPDFLAGMVRFLSDGSAEGFSCWPH